MKCLNCYNENDDNAAVCQSCGMDLLSSQSLKHEQEKQSESIHCEKCGNPTNRDFSYVWAGGKVTGVKEVGVRHETTKTIITTLITYSNITAISTGLCHDCYKKRLNSFKLATYVILAITVLVPLSTFLLYLTGNAEGFCAGLSVLVIFLFLPALDKLKIYLGKDKNRILEGLLLPFARTKIKNLGLDTLWNQQEFTKLTDTKA